MGATRLIKFGTPAMSNGWETIIVHHYIIIIIAHHYIIKPIIIIIKPITIIIIAHQYIIKPFIIIIVFLGEPKLGLSDLLCPIIQSWKIITCNPLPFLDHLQTVNGSR